MKRRVVITGIGMVSPLGNTVNESWENAKVGQNGIDFIKRINTDHLDVKIAGEVKDLDIQEILGKRESKRMDRFSQLGLIATMEAVEDSKIPITDENRDRFGVYFTSGVGGLETIEKEREKGLTKGHNRISPFFIPMAIINLLAGQIAIKYGLKGICTSPVTACAASTNAIGDAFRAIKDGYLDAAIAGGAEASICDLGLSGFYVMRALSDSDDPSSASTPFDLNRSGFVMGEGSGALVLEEYESAVKRGAKIHAEIIGYGATCDANHITAPVEGGLGAANCMKNAMIEGEVNSKEIDYINAHGTSTPLNDKTETAAIKNALGENANKVSISSTKSMTGHLLGASGAVEAIFTIKAVEDGFIPPTINYKTKDPECDLDYTTNQGKEREVKYAMSNSLGFGGHNATLLFKKVI
ncbi:beta-ketoacyl-ACP synthase II [Mycoplasmatota bacterium]|nr:beta-ketoacyl-ACP synthase II [Mycoplasmatota bacterium]